MEFAFSHNNINVTDLNRSVEFYQKALGLGEIKRTQAPDGSFILVFMGDGKTSHQLELTWLRDRADPYNLGDNESHIAFESDDFEASRTLHKQMGCVCFENFNMGIYFIEDPDGYWIEILPKK